MYDHTVVNRYSAPRGEGWALEREGGREVGGFALMTPWFSKDIQCHV